MLSHNLDLQEANNWIAQMSNLEPTAQSPPPSIPTLPANNKPLLHDSKLAADGKKSCSTALVDDASPTIPYACRCAIEHIADAEPLSDALVNHPYAIVQSWPRLLSMCISAALSIAKCPLTEFARALKELQRVRDIVIDESVVRVGLCCYGQGRWA
ncbi:hypothetical protein BC828DRAFT_433182 [Blastocladiella britannica]|nr:hypothetical protein BC828DRAFT_433182 [Blastocladiella britannica]